jgi:hypothetical protein
MATPVERVWASRSRIRNGKLDGCAWSVHENSRARWVTQAPVGFTVQPAKWTRRLSSSTKKCTSRRRSEIVSTVKKSTAGMLCACWRRNLCQEGPGRLPAGPSPDSLRIFRTVVADTFRPSPLISPAIR